MVGPEDLREAIHFDEIADVVSRVLAGEGEVVVGMPILGGHDERVLVDEVVGHCYDLLSMGNGQGPGRDEIVLDVDEQESFHEGVVRIRSYFEVEAGFCAAVVFVFVEAVESGGAVSHIPFRLFEFHEDVHGQHLPAEIAFI